MATMVNHASRTIQSRTLARVVRLFAPELLLGVRFLPAARRDPVLATAALLHLLDEVIAGRSADLSAADDEPNASSNCACGAASLAGRHAAAHNIIDYLYELAGRKSNDTTGRPDMDAFVQTVAQQDIPRSILIAIADGLAESHRWARVPTKRVLDDVTLEYAIPMIHLYEHLVQSRPSSGRSINALALGLGLAHRLWNLGLEARRDRCAVPLEWLATHGARDRDLITQLSRGSHKSADGPAVPHCAASVKTLLRHAAQQLAAGQPYIDALPRPAMRCLAMVAGVHAAALCRALANQEPDLRLLGQLSEPEAINRFLGRHPFRPWRLALTGRLDPRLARVSACPAESAV